MAAEESYPADLRYHAEHDWARIEGDEATLGITWFAPDALGDIVHFEAPEEGGTATKDTSYGEVESVKAVSDVIAPLSGEIVAVNQAVVSAPETINEDPVRGGLARAHPARRPVRGRRPARRRRLPQGARGAVSAARYLSLTDADREEMLAAIGVDSVDDLFEQVPPGVRLGRELDLEPALSEQEIVDHLSALAGRNVGTERELSFLGAGIYDHYVPAIVDMVLSRGELLTAYTPYQPEVSQGVLQAIFEYQTVICELTGMDVSNASGYDGTTVAADAGFVAKHATGPLEGRARRDAQPAGAPGRQDVRAGLRPRGRRGAARRRRHRPGPARGGLGRRGRGLLPAAELLRLPRAGARPRRRRGARGRARRSRTSTRCRSASSRRPATTARRSRSARARARATTSPSAGRTTASSRRAAT